MRALEANGHEINKWSEKLRKTASYKSLKTLEPLKYIP